MLIQHLHIASQLPVLDFELADTRLLSCQGLANAGLAELFSINLRQTAPHRRLAQLHIPADLCNAQALGPDYFNDSQFEARVDDSSF
jgi:hypothetical protein